MCGRVLGTYLHGPVLARNPALADVLLGWVLGVAVETLAPVDDAPSDSLRQERLRAVKARRVRGPRRVARRRRVEDPDRERAGADRSATDEGLGVERTRPTSPALRWAAPAE